MGKVVGSPTATNLRCAEMQREGRLDVFHMSILREEFPKKVSI